jgi:hypothetical protein
VESVRVLGSVVPVLLLVVLVEGRFREMDGVVKSAVFDLVSGCER